MINIYLFQEHTRLIFDLKFIDCDPLIMWFPFYNRWEIHLRIKFKYLKIIELIFFRHDFYKYYDEFIKIIEEKRNMIAKDFENYFNDLWC